MVWSCKTYAFKNLDYIPIHFPDFFPSELTTNSQFFSLIERSILYWKKIFKKKQNIYSKYIFFILSIYFNICTKVLVLLEVNEHSELMA